MPKLVNMRAVIQRVKSAKVEVEGSICGQIDQGLLVLLGITQDDQASDADWLIKKMVQLRIFSDEDGKMNLSVEDVKGGILLVSQFTLYADAKKGNRPSYIRSAAPSISVPIYESFIESLKARFQGPVETGIFGAMMDITLINDGPVTIILDSRQQDF